MFGRAIERRALWLAEDAARELPNLPLEDALQLVHLYFERGSPKAEPAARRWLVRYLGEGTAVASAVTDDAYATVRNGSGGSFIVAMHPAGRDDPADMAFTLIAG